MSLFGSTLSISDGFTSVFQKFSSGLASTSLQFTSFINSLNRSSNDIQNSGSNTGNKWTDAFKSIKEKGVSTFKDINSSVTTFSNSTTGLITKLTAGFISVAGTVKGLKTGFKTAMEFQDARMTLDALYDSETKGGKKFKMATDFANKTPWEEKETVGSLVKLKAYSLPDDEKMMTMMSDLGATFKSMGQNMDTAVEAMGDMVNGQWERMTSFGIKRETLDKYVKDKGMKAFDNKQGQITDKDALMSAFTSFMKDKHYTGMTDKLGETASGKLSTMTGNLKKSLAELVGISEDGKVKSGSLFDNFIKGMTSFITKMNQFTTSSSFDKITKAVSDVGSTISSGLGYLADHPEITSTLLKFTAGLLAFNVISSLVSPIFSMVGGVSALLPVLGAIIAFLAPVFVGVDAVLALFDSLSSILSSDGLLHQGISWLLGNIPLVGTFLQQWWEDSTTTIKEWLNNLWNWIENKFGFGSTGKGDTSETNPHIHPDNDTAHWFTGNLKDNKVNYQTATDLKNNGSIVNTDASKSTINNKTDVNIHVDKVEKTADVDNFMDTVVKRMNKYSATRNNLG